MAKMPETTIIRAEGDVVTIPRKEYESLVTSKAALGFILKAGTDYGNADRAVIEAVRKTVRQPEKKPKEQAEFTKENPEGETDA